MLTTAKKRSVLRWKLLLARPHAHRIKYCQSATHNCDTREPFWITDCVICKSSRLVLVVVVVCLIIVICVFTTCMAPQVSGLNNKSVPLDNITFWFEDVSKEQSTESSNAQSRSMRYPNVRSLRQLHALDEALRAMAPQSFSVIPNPYSDIAVLRAASLASSSPLMKSRTACEKLSEYFQRLMDVNIACKSKILLDFIVGPAMDVTRAKSYYRMETKQNPHFQAQRLVR